MLKVAITGNIASGKSTIEEFLKAKSFNVLDTDIVSHDLLKSEHVKKQILEEFKSYDLLENNEISRPKLGKIIFKDDFLRKKVENILHPLIKNEIGRFFRQLENKIQEDALADNIAFTSVPLLFEAKFENFFDKIILIYSDDESRLKRLINRNNYSLEDAENRLKSQISQDKKISLADYVIYNNSTVDDLQTELEKVLKLL